MLAFDLDHFKSINDRFGHKRGDAVLDLFAKVARKTMRADDVIGRIGGEEFVAILPGKLAEACIAAERVRAAFRSGRRRARQPANPGDGEHRGGLRLPHARSTLIARADAALYRAKANGRNRVEPDEEMVDRSAADGARANDRPIVGKIRSAAAIAARSIAVPGAECGGLPRARKIDAEKEKGAGERP